MSRLAEAKELVRQELLEALQNKSGDSVRDLFEIYDKLRTICLLYTSPSPRDLSTSRMPSSA